MNDAEKGMISLLRSHHHSFVLLNLKYVGVAESNKNLFIVLILFVCFFTTICHKTKRFKE